MGKYDYEIEKYIVLYGANKEKKFKDEDKAVKFAKKKHDEGYVVSIKQIRNLVGWC